MKKERRALNIDLPIDLYNMYGKLCIDLGITKTEGITQYLLYLQKQHHMRRKPLHEDSDSTFKLDASKSK